ncbi:unnamed protein product [Ectocarpus sp. 6 AP-2014]
MLKCPVIHAADGASLSHPCPPARFVSPCSLGEVRAIRTKVKVMGGQQSRRVEDTPAGEPESWMNRVAVKPSENLVKQLQRQQQYQVSRVEPEPSAPESQSKQQEESQAFRREREHRREEDDNRMLEVLAAKDAETAHLSKIVISVVIPDVSAGQQLAVCDEESQAVVKCYRREKGNELNCGKLVDILEECASTQ